MRAWPNDPSYPRAHLAAFRRTHNDERGDERERYAPVGKLEDKARDVVVFVRTVDGLEFEVDETLWAGAEFSWFCFGFLEVVEPWKVVENRAREPPMKRYAPRPVKPAPSWQGRLDDDGLQ